jgi:dipeptidyl aminopeptidase/acylaminoacyl peptidase
MTKEKIDFFSNERHVRVDAPPAFIVHATDDKAVPVENAFVYHKALTEHNVNSQLVILPNGGHGFGLANKFDWFDSLIKWMDASDIR